MANKFETVCGSILIIAFVILGIVLTRRVVDVPWKLLIVNNASRSENTDLIFQSENGVDVHGVRVRHEPPPAVVGTVVFMLRGVTIRADLDYWHAVAALLPKDSRVRLIAFCDDAICRKAAKATTGSDFPVVAYGEVESSEALIDADAKGNCVLLREEWPLPKNVRWRTPEVTPAVVVREVLQ